MLNLQYQVERLYTKGKGYLKIEDDHSNICFY